MSMEWLSDAHLFKGRKKEQKARRCGAAPRRELQQQVNFPTGFRTGKIGSMIEGLARHYIQEHERGLSVCTFLDQISLFSQI